MPDAPHRDTIDRDVFFKFYADSWRGDEKLRLCSLAARGLWIELMAFAHKSGGYVRLNGKPPSIKELAVIVGAKASDVAKYLDELSRYDVCSVDPTDGAIYSRRMVRDAARREASKANGKLGGRPKEEPRPKPRSNLTHNLDPNLGSNLTETPIALAIGSSSSSTPGSAVSESRKIPTEADRLFARFWACYPRKTGKGDAERKFAALKPTDALLAEMLQALSWQAQTPQWTKDGGKFIPHPSTWLHQRRWEDEPFHGVEAPDPLAANDAAWAGVEAQIAGKA